MTELTEQERSNDESLNKNTSDESYLNQEFVYRDTVTNKVYSRFAHEIRDTEPPYMVYMKQPWSWVFDLEGIDVLTISGGRNGGGKTENVALNVLERCFMEPLNVVCFREHNVTLDDSIRRTLLNWIRHPFAQWDNDWWDYRDRGPIYGDNGSVISFKGISSSTSTSRGFRGQTYIDLAIIDEAQYITDQTFDDLDPTIRQEGSKLILIGNPHSANDPWWSRFIKHADEVPEYFHIHLTYKDNIFFPDKQERRRQYYEQYEPQVYEHMWLGKFAATDPENPPIATYDDVMKCYELAKDRPDLVNLSRSHEKHSGYDIARSPTGDKNVFSIRSGGVIEKIEEWTGRPFQEICTLIKLHSKPVCPKNLFYDAHGLGYSFGDFLDDDPTYPAKKVPVRAGDPVAGDTKNYEPGMTNKQFFTNRGSQLFWTLKMRIENTKRLLAGENINPKKCLFISPSVRKDVVQKFATQTSGATYNVGNDRAIKFDKRFNNPSSPDMLDSVAHAFFTDSEHGLTYDLNTNENFFIASRSV